jgi:RHS repeat-associated protein
MAAEPSDHPGQYADDETGYSYNWFRDYDPSLGRYLQTDPIGLRSGVNRYAYVEQRPTRLFDSNGLDSRDGNKNSNP